MFSIQDLRANRPATTLPSLSSAVYRESNKDNFSSSGFFVYRKIEILQTRELKNYAGQGICPDKMQDC